MSKQKAKILIVEDEIEIVRVLQRSLIAHKYEVVIAQNGEMALTVVQQQSPDLMLLDIELPGMSGLDVCKRVRANSDLPIIIISVRNKERDKVYALDLGADDYLSKPFGIDEVLARIRVALRHAGRMPPRLLETEPSITLGPLYVDFTQHLVFVKDQEVKLTPTEYDLLKVFLQNRGKIMTQHMLLTQVWGNNHDSKSHYLHVYINHLRRKIEPDATQPRFLQTIAGVGYRFSEDAYES